MPSQHRLAGEEAEPPGAPAWERLGELDLPVLVLVGAHDLPHVVERSGAVASAVARARFKELASSAHVPQIDDPETFIAEVAQFLDEH